MTWRLDGVIIEKYKYDPFGKPFLVDPVADTVRELSIVSNPYLFTGREYDYETRVYYYRNRYYDSNTGRFITVDPNGYEGGINLYLYVNNNPINLIDPLGLKGCGPGNWGDCLIPDIPLGYDFSEACDEHDDCYKRCGKKKKDCDKAFLKNMKKVCSKYSILSKQRYECRLLAEIYYRTVKGSCGHTAYFFAQRGCKKGGTNSMNISCDRQK